MDTNSQSCQSDKTENSKITKNDKKSDKEETSPKKLKRLISDPVTLKNPFNPVASDNSKFRLRRFIVEVQGRPNSVFCTLNSLDIYPKS